HVESVAWITERKNILSALFYLLALYTYLDYEDGSGSKAKRRYALALFLFLLALLSKIVVCSFPIILILIRWMRGREISAGYLIRLVPFFILSLVFGLITKWWEAMKVGASGVEWDISVAERLMISGRAAWFYVGKIFFPSGFTFIYPRWDPGAVSGVVWLFTLSVVAVLVLLFLFRKRIGRAPVSATLFYLITLSPMLGFLDIFFFRYSFVSDHFPYIASLGIIALAVGIGSYAIEKVGGGERKVKLAASALVIIVLSVISYGQCYKFKGKVALWEDTLAKNPNAWIAHNNLGRIIFNSGDLKGAFAHYEKAAKIWPHSSEVNYNMGLSLFEFGRLTEAEAYYRKALKSKPAFAEATSGLSVVLSYGGDYEEAEGLGFKATMLRPGEAGIQSNFGLVLARGGKTDEAIGYYRKAIELDPTFVDGYNNLGIALSAKGDYSGAVEYFKAALTVSPDYSETYYNYGVTLDDMGRNDEALSHYRKATELNPKNAMAYNNIGSLYFKRGDYERAAENYRKALAIKKDFTDAGKNLSITLKRIEKKVR
ncbi:MAG: tetratricopeptide repeat protein, partial [Thermodesulfobacteriota bacterium]